MRISVTDAVRYMGAGRGNEEVRRMAEETAAELEKKITPRFTWRAFRTEIREDGVYLPEAGETLKGRLAVSMLSECGSRTIRDPSANFRLVDERKSSFREMRYVLAGRDMSPPLSSSDCNMSVSSSAAVTT